MDGVDLAFSRVCNVCCKENGSDLSLSATTQQPLFPPRSNPMLLYKLYAMRPGNMSPAIVTTGSPKDSPSAAVLDPPNGNGWSMTSADANSSWNSLPADVRGSTWTCGGTVKGETRLRLVVGGTLHTG